MGDVFDSHDDAAKVSFSTPAKNVDARPSGTSVENKLTHI